MTVILLVRHGRTAANQQGLLLGRHDPPLDEEGRRQAERLADRLAGRLRGDEPARIVSSPLDRCRATAEIIAGAAGAPGIASVEVDERWIELDYGTLDGTALSQVPAGVWDAWQADAGWAPEGGESLRAVGARVRRACDELVQPADGDVIVVSHVSPIKAAVAWALGVGDEVTWRMWLQPASITHVGVTGGRPSLLSFNEVSHLG